MAEAKIRLSLDGAVSVVGGLNDIGLKISDIDRLSKTASNSIKNLSGTTDSLGISAKQTAAAMRNVPAQMTDIVVSLQAGQAPLTVLLQQGGQLKDMFGGIGPAAKAMATYVLGIVNPFTLAAGAAALIAVAYSEGSKEADAYNKALILTGNAAGTTANQLHGMAENISKSVGTQGGAAEALAAMAGTGRIAAGSLENFAKVAVQMEKTVGQSVADTAKDFAELGKSPVEASEKLNEKYRYLTASVYAQIKAMQDQGRTDDAAAIAQKAYADAFGDRAKQIQENLGYIEGAYKASINTIKNWWDAVAGVGREDTNADQVSAISSQIKAVEERLGRFNAPGGGFLQSMLAGSAGRELVELKDRQAALQEVIRMEGRSATATAASQTQERARISFMKEGDKYLSKAAITEREITMAREQGKVAGMSAAEIESRIADIRAKNPDKNSGAAIRAEATAYATLITSIGEKIAAGKLEISGYDKLSESQKLTIKLDEAIKTGKSKVSAEHIANAKAMIATVAANDAVIASNKQILADMEARNSLRKAEEDGIKSYFQSQQDGYNAAVKGSSDALKAAQAEFDQFGMSKSQIAELTLRTLELNLAKFNGVDADNAGAIAAQQQIDKQKELIGTLKGTQTKEEYKAIFDSINSTAHDTFISIFDSGKSAFDRLRDTLKNGLLDLLYSMTLKKWIISIGASVTGGAVSGAAMASNPLMGGSAGSAMSAVSMLSSVKSAYSAITSGFSGLSASVSNGVASGMQMAGVGAATPADMSVGALNGTSGAASMAGTAAGYAGGIAAGKVIGTAISGQYSVGNHGSAIVNIGTAIGAIWGPLGAAIGGAIGGLVNRAFGMGPKEVKNAGIEGNFGSAGFAGNEFANWKQDGGWFRSDKSGHDTSNLDSATAKQFTDGFSAIKSVSSDFAASLGIDASSIASYSEKISVTLTSDAAKNQEIITKMFSDLGDRIAATLAPNISGFAKEGEAASATLQRLSTAITTSNSWLSMLRQRLFQVSMAGADAASKLADTFGGLEGLTAASKSFYELYYTEGERAARSTQDMTTVLAALNLAMPETKDGLRALAGSLDLNTASGRAAYATLLTIAPEFAAVADITAKLAKETADKLMSTFTGGGQLLPALDATALKTLLLKDTLVSTYAAAGNISTLFLDVNSGLISFGIRATELAGGLTGAQLASGLLNSEITDLHLGADKARVDFAGLGTALDGIDTETFMNTVVQVFQNLAERISGVIGDIGAERIAVREAAIQMINPTVMSKAAIQNGIAGINTKLPGNAGMVTALNAQNAAAEKQAALDATRAAVIGKYSVLVSDNLASYNTSRSASVSSLAAFQQILNTGVSMNWRTPVSGISKNANYSETAENFAAGQKFKASGYNSYGATTAQNNNAYAAYSSQFDAAKNALATYTANSNAYTSALASVAAQQAAASAATNAANDSAKAAQLAYSAALQNFAIDASKSVSKLSKLREETVKYYDAQKQLADLMTTSAAGLRGTVADYRYSQLSDAQQFDQLQASYATAYAMALSTDGETLAGYGNTLNSALNPLLEKARSVLSDAAYNTFAATALARADTIAGRLESLTPTNYAADSLAMLGTIDATLAALDASSKSAEKIISDAVNAGSDKTAAGLHAVIAALTGQSIPAFATGGSYMGGIALVGETGPELINFSQPGQVYNAGQTRSMLGSGGNNNTEMVAELRALRQEVALLRTEARATAVHTSKIARQGDRMEHDGLIVRTDVGAPLQTVAA